MHSPTNALNAQAKAPAASGLRAGLKPALAILAAIACGQLPVLQQTRAVLTSGAFFDTDDAMRIVQVRNLLNGQGWFDMTEWRLDPPDGVFSHWSRIVDAALAGLIAAFQLVLDPVMAERAARIVYPLPLTFLLYVAIVPLCGETVGRRHAGFALFAAFLTVPFELQFQPGRVDHHSIQIVLLTAMVASAIASLDRPRAAALCAAFLALSIGVSLENLPFAPIAALPAVAWIMNGAEADGRRLLWFAGSLFACATAVFLATVGPARWPVAVSDAFSIAQLSALLAGAALCGMLSVATPRLRARGARVAVAAGAATLAGGALVAAFPVLSHGPFADLDPLVRTVWLETVIEVQPIVALARSDPIMAIPSLVPLLVGLAGAALAARRSRGEARARWIALCVPLALGVACTFWMLRVSYSTAPLAVPGALYLALEAQRRLARRTKLAGEFSALCAVLIVTSSPGVSALTRPFVASATGAQGVRSAIGAPAAAGCFAPEAMRKLGEAPKGLVFNELDLGPFILAFTPHSVVSGPYHRASHGDRMLIEAMRASPAQAMTIIRGSGADYVAVCLSDPESASPAPGSLEAQLARKAPVEGLAPVPLAAAPLAVFRVVR